MGDNNYIDDCRAGNDDAARRLFEQHADQLLDLARARISQRLAGRLEAEDVVQSVFRTFFQRMRAGEFTFRSEEDVIKLLVRITLFKTLRKIAFHQKAKRDARQETGTGQGNHEQLMSVMAAGPTPEEAVIFLDQLEYFLDQLSPEDKKICRMRIEGYTNKEIAEALDINDRRIRRLMERLRGLAQRTEWADLYQLSYRRKSNTEARTKSEEKENEQTAIPESEPKQDDTPTPDVHLEEQTDGN